MRATRGRRIPINLRDAAQAFTAYFAVPVALFYPTGFLTLWLQFSRYYDLHYGTAWQAVSLVDRTTVLGRGASILVVALIAGVVFSWWVGRIFLWSEWSKVPAEGDSAWYKPSWHKLLGLASLFYASSVALVFFVVYSRVLQHGSWSMAAGKLSVETFLVKSGTTEGILRDRQCSDKVINLISSKNNLDFWPDAVVPALIFIAGGILGGYLIYRNFSKRCNSRGLGRPRTDHYPFPNPFMFFKDFKEGVLSGWVYLGLITSYLASVASVVVLAFYLQISLPFMWYTSLVDEEYKSPYKDSGTESTEDAARFLSHSSGYWYAISLPICKDSQGIPYKDKDKEEYYYRVIMAIPDKNAANVQVVDPT